MTSARPDPEALLRVLRTGARAGRGRLKVFLGAAPGVGKTYEMLGEGAARAAAGLDVVVGVAETHGRPETAARLRGLEVIPLRRVAHHDHLLTEMDIDAVLARRPALVLVDELAHTNAPGSRHDKRWQDVEELLDAGIDVWSTLNVQHLESLNDVVASFTHVRVRETLPDRMLDDAEVEVVDIPPDELIERLRQGKVYIPEEANRALGAFFSKSNLSALRELALRRTAQAVDAQMLDYLRAHALGGAWAASDRLVVAVSEQPGAAELVRAAKRLADALRAPWTAVHIETPRSARFTPQQTAQLAETLHLATQLGAQVASVPAETVIEGLTRFAGSAHATQLIVGKSARSRWFELRHGSIVDALVRGRRGHPGLAVHVLPMGKGPAPVAQGPEPARWGTAGGYLASLALVVLVTLAGAVISPGGSITDLGLLYLLPVLVAATRQGLRTAVVTSLASSLAYNFFFLPPTHTLTIEDPRNIVTVMVLLAVAIAGSQLAARVRAQALLAQASAARSSALAGFARLLTGISASEELAQVLCAEIGRLLDAQAALLLPEGGDLESRAGWPALPHFEMLDLAAARWAFENDQPTGRGSDTLTASEWLFQPLAAGGKVLGVLGLARPDARAPVRSDQVPLLQSLIDQGSLALERIALEARMAELSQERERDRLRQTLLSSVSHDLRTPLTTLLGTLAEIAPADAVQAGQLAETRSAAERLNRFVANLLDMARIESGALERSTQPVDLGEAVAAVLHDMRSALAGQVVERDIPLDTPMVLVDPDLFQHCLLNLIDNALKHGALKHGALKHGALKHGAAGQDAAGQGDDAAPIGIVARRDALGLDLTISDHGPGIPEGQEARIFETFIRIGGSDRTGGSGLGLAIVLGFAQAMGLAVRAVNRAGGGADFTIRFDNAHLKDWPDE